MKEEGLKVIMEDCLKEDTTKVEDILGEIIQVQNGGPPEMEDP